MTIAANPSAAPDAAAPSEAGTSLYAKAVIALFFVVLFIPGSFYVGIRLTPMRVYLLLMFVPMILRLLGDPTARPTAVDALVLVTIGWRCLGILANHGTGQMVFAVSLFLETSAGYLLGRAFIRSAADFRFFIRCFLFVLLALTPLVLLEFVTHQRVLKDLAGMVLEQVPSPQPAQGMRFGMTRVILAFEHPTVFGAVCAMAFVNAFYVFRIPLNIAFAALVGFLAILTISSSALLTLAMQIALIGYAVVFRTFAKKWVVLIVVSTVLSLSFELLFGKSVLEFVISEVMFNPVSGDSRALHFQFAFREVMRNPFFGVGLGDWRAPFWTSQVTDSYWLSLALRYGVPALLLTGLMFGVHFLKVAYATGLNNLESRLRVGYNITFATAMVMFFYTSFFHSTFIFFMMYCGAGAWFYDRRLTNVLRKTPGIPRERRRPGPTLRGAAMGTRSRPATADARGVGPGRLGGR